MSLTALRIGTRGSELALWQARHVADRLARELDIRSELVIVHTSGDRDHSRALHQLPGSGFFTKELQRALLGGEVDAVVHSLKDLPIDEPQGLALGAILDRADPRDLLVARRDAVGTGGLGLKPGSRLGTSSLRRSAQSLALQADLQVRALRGNVPTRLRRLAEGDFDAILLAKAGVDRLALDLGDLVGLPLETDRFLPSPGQGALAIEIRDNDETALSAVSPLHSGPVAEATGCERAVLKGLGGGCHLPLGALAVREGDTMRVAVAWGDLDEAVSRATVVRVAGEGPDSATAAHMALEQLASQRGR